MQLFGETHLKFSNPIQSPWLLLSQEKQPFLLLLRGKYALIVAKPREDCLDWPLKNRGDGGQRKRFGT
jgi:hypothetical protein